MADVKKVIEIEVNTESGEVNKLNKELDQTDKNIKKSEKSTKGFGGAWKKVGTAIKAAGIGLLIATLAKVGEVLSRNQGVLDGFQTSMSAISITVNQVVNGLTNAYNTAREATGGFDALGKVFTAMLDLALKPFEFAWAGIQKAILSTQLAWEQSIFGDGDDETIKRLTSDLEDVDATITRLGEETEKSATEYWDNFSEAFSEMGVLATASVDELSKISIEANIEQAKYITDLGKRAQLAEVQQQGLIEKYDREAELLRQVRDETNNSFEERIAANQRLGEVLDKQAEEERELIRLQQVSLEERFKAGLIAEQEYLVERQRLANEEAAIEARITGFKSEQLINRTALANEQRDADLAAIKEFEAEQIQLIKQQDSLRFALMQEGIDKELAASAAKYDELFAQAQGNKELELAVIEAQEREAEAIYDKYRAKQRQKDKEDAQIKQDLAMQSAALASDLLVEFASLTDAESKRGFQIQKAASLAQATTSTVLAAIEAFKTAAASPITSAFPAYPFTQAAAAGAFGAVRIAKIASTQYGGSGGGASAAGGGGRSGGGQSPNVQFNTVGGSGINQLNESITAQNDPVKAYVVSSEVSSAQSLDRNRQSNATFG